jgi:predicted peptidase
MVHGMIETYPYHIYYPATYETEQEKQWPLLLFLHGAGERGNDLSKVEEQGLPRYLQDKDDFPFVVAYPQCPGKAYWNIPTLNDWLRQVQAEVRFDETRVYLTGLSMGGYGTWHWAAAHPEKFAAILPICGGGNTAQAKRLIKMPIWAFHGVKDTIVPASETIQMVEAIKRAGGNPILTLYPDLFHDSWTRTYNNTEVYDWMLKHQKQR